MNELVTTGPTTSPETDRVTLDQWLGLRDQVVSQVRRLVFLWFHSGLGSQAELSRHLGVDKSTVSRHHKALVAERLLQPLETNQGKRNDLRSCKAQLPVENPPPAPQAPPAPQPAPTPETTTHLSQARSVREGELLAMPRELGPGEYTHPDYNKIIQLFEQIDDLTHANEFTDNFSREEWFSILGSWRSVGDCIRAKCDYIRRHESDRETAITVDVLV